MRPDLGGDADGRVLVVGGDSPKGSLASAELWEPKTGKWRAAGQMTGPRTGHAAVLLEDRDPPHLTAHGRFSLAWLGARSVVEQNAPEQQEAAHHRRQEEEHEQAHDGEAFTPAFAQAS